jgi:4-amino-4-deoxy-L-arabinose transferase-like glycosyltransferase
MEGEGRLSRRAIVGLALFAAALRLPTLGLHRLVEGDGVHYAQLARSILAGDWSGLANPYWSNLWPGLIAAASWSTGLGVVAAGRLASLVSGVLLVPATAALATRLGGPTPGLVAGLLCAVHPWLIHFSTLVFTESFFALTLVSLLLAGLSAAEGWGAAVLAGVLGGAALTTRPEAYAGIAAVALVFARSVAVRRTRGDFARAGAFLGIVLLFVLGRALLVHHYYGRWDLGLGTKGTANLFVGLATTDAEVVRVTTEVGPDGTNVLARKAQDVTLAGFALTHPALLARHVARNLLRLAASALRVFPFVPPAGERPAPWAGAWPVVLWIAVIAGTALGVLGVVQAGRDPRARPGALLLLATAALYALGLTPLLVHDRLVVPLVPLFLVFLAFGLVRGARVVFADERNIRTWLAAGLAAVGVLSLVSLLRTPRLAYASDHVVQRETGEWLAARYPQDRILMTAAASVGFYFHDAAHADREVGLPWGDADEVIRRARQQDAALLAVPEWHLRAAQHPAAGVLLHPDLPHPDLRHVATLGDDARGRIFVYEVQPPPGDPATRP